MVVAETDVGCIHHNLMSFTDIPSEIIVYETLQYLDSKSLFKCRLINTRMLNLLSDTNILKMFHSKVWRHLAELFGPKTLPNAILKNG
jgi:hypothetical protein